MLVYQAVGLSVYCPWPVLPYQLVRVDKQRYRRVSVAAQTAIHPDASGCWVNLTWPLLEIQLQIQIERNTNVNTSTNTSTNTEQTEIQSDLPAALGALIQHFN